MKTGTAMRRIVIGVAMLAAAVDVAGAARPSATVIVPPQLRPAHGVVVATAQPVASAHASSGIAQGWLVATAAFGLLGFGMRTRRRVAPHAIG